MKYKFKDAFQFKWEGLKGWAFNSKDDFQNASAVYFEISGRHGRTKTISSDRIYYVLKGKGVFQIDEKKIKVGETDVIIVPKNTSYDYWAEGGILKLFLVHTPAFDENKEINLK